jgi:plasmid stabilization system protein ParE
MDFKIVWSDAAIADLQGVCSYAAQHDPQAAVRLGRGILDHVRVLASFPFIGPTYPRGVRGTLREIVFGTHRIFYDVRARIPSASRFFTSGTGGVTNRHFECPNHAMHASAKTASRDRCG